MRKLTCTKETYERFVSESLSNINEYLRDFAQVKMSKEKKEGEYKWMMFAKEMLDYTTALWEAQGGELPEVTICKNCEKGRKACSICDNYMKRIAYEKEI
jgi:hypothetical protein